MQLTPNTIIAHVISPPLSHKVIIITTLTVPPPPLPITTTTTTAPTAACMFASLPWRRGCTLDGVGGDTEAYCPPVLLYILAKAAWRREEARQRCRFSPPLTPLRHLRCCPLIDAREKCGRVLLSLWWSRSISLCENENRRWFNL